MKASVWEVSLFCLRILLIPTFVYVRCTMAYASMWHIRTLQHSFALLLPPISFPVLSSTPMYLPRTSVPALPLSCVSSPGLIFTLIFLSHNAPDTLPVLPPALHSVCDFRIQFSFLPQHAPMYVNVYYVNVVILWCISLSLLYFSFTQIMTRTLLFACIIVIICEDKNVTDLAHVQQLPCCSRSCTTSEWFRWHNYDSPCVWQRPWQFWIWSTLVMERMLSGQAGCAPDSESAWEVWVEIRVMHCSNGLIRMKVVSSEGTSRSFAVWRKCVLSQLILGFVHNSLTLYKAPLL